MGLGTELFMAKIYGDPVVEAIKDDERMDISLPYNWDDLTSTEQDKILLKENKELSLKAVSLEEVKESLREEFDEAARNEFNKLSGEEQEGILSKKREEISFAKAEHSLNNSGIIAAKWAVRDSVFTSLNLQGEVVMATDGRALRKQEVDEARHQSLMENDPVYKEKVELEIKQGMEHDEMLCKALSMAHSRAGL